MTSPDVTILCPFNIYTYTHEHFNNTSRHMKDVIAFIKAPRGIQLCYVINSYICSTLSIMYFTVYHEIFRKGTKLYYDRSH